jgi:putative SbcD/Mre11-related phosphoesterase
MKKVIFLEDSVIINDIYVLTDFHIGKGDEYGFEINDVIEKLEKNFKTIENIIKIKKIVILGDFKHDFGKIEGWEVNLCLKIIDYLLKKVKKENIIFIKGNHDNILIPILKKRGLKLYDYYLFMDIGFLHGDKKIKDVINKSKLLILGHLHPSITLSDKYKSERFKCFLKGKWKNRWVIIIPSFNPVNFGYDLSGIKERSNNDFFIISNKELLNFKVMIYNPIDQKVHKFEELKKLI